MAKFEGFDYLAIEELLSEEERMVRDTVREFVDDKLLPIINQHFWRHVPHVPDPADGGAGALRREPERLRLRGNERRGYGLANQELERGDSGCAA